MSVFASTHSLAGLCAREGDHLRSLSLATVQLPVRHILAALRGVPVLHLKSLAACDTDPPPHSVLALSEPRLKCRVEGCQPLWGHLTSTGLRSTCPALLAPRRARRGSSPSFLHI
jgi:hypothetical protein